MINSNIVEVENKNNLLKYATIFNENSIFCDIAPCCQSQKRGLRNYHCDNLKSYKFSLTFAAWFKHHHQIDRSMRRYNRQ
jgi:hypothetical protein